MKSLIASGDSLATQTWQLVQGSPLARLSRAPRPTAAVIRGGTGRNYGQFMPDVHAMYQNALTWRIRGDTAHGNEGRDIANAWSGSLQALGGNAHRFLMAGTQGWRLANVGELLRGYPGFDLGCFQSMLGNIFYPMNNDFLVSHNGACDTHYRVNWDTCDMASVFAIGSFLDDQGMVNQAVNYFHGGVGNGCIYRAANSMHENNRYYQGEESGRDQVHTMGGFGWMTVLCEMAWKRGIDLYGTDGNRYAKAAHYIARYNGGTSVPCTSYSWQQRTNCSWKTEATIGSWQRGDTSPIWGMVRTTW
ncbi:alginate lyase family protein [Glycomyces sp. TRM65418]|uniref:alginate lyase family protein n=1 Tax=Glycomyces sp. TRM65418 TaxID=2867006 RepID=UPI001CE60AE2|nr:alginate lyase family protein [Glycomyces sp. TRM65418]MCC3764489.1 alginate lyase family protein [Glycomyces sp. TRM65418]QZD54160.1 alginate lyase family protein [Glycomyces sp. TRM65418]